MPLYKKKKEYMEMSSIVSVNVAIGITVVTSRNLYAFDFL